MRSHYDVMLHDQSVVNTQKESDKSMTISHLQQFAS
jgi:hypothetical protein